jgi:outer membrane cobalamin receptor
MSMQGFNERRAKGQGFAITREQIEQRHARLVTDLLRMVPGVHIEWRFGGSRITITGSSRAARGNCSARVLLDGIEFRWGSSTIDDIPTFDIEAIEVFRTIAELPPEMAGPESSCGVIAVWTRRGR